MSNILVFSKMVPSLKEATENINNIIEKSYTDKIITKPQHLVYSSCNNIPIKINTPFDMPKQTSLWCWNCALPFTTQPKYLPINKLIDKQGVFCTFSCEAKYINTFSDKTKRSELRKLLCELIKVYYPGRKFIIIEAPEKERMKHYGGNLTVDEYKKKVNDNDINMFMVCDMQIQNYDCH